MSIRNLTTSTENRKPYGGHTRSLVIAIDIGTTFSGVSYAILEPGEIPKIHGVTRFPGQEHVAGNSKIPSVIYYDKQGKMMATGAEADTAAVISQAEDYGWIKTELFKLRLRPRTMKLNMNGMHLSPLPRRKTAVHVFGDFLAYLYQCTRVFITDTHGNGAALWNAVEPDIQFVLSHPNGWEGAQQSKMRRAAVYGNLIPDNNAGKARIRFVTEGEASLHACVLNGLAADVLSNPSKHGFLIADAGGGTLDISAYAIRGTAPLVMEEIAPPDCIFAGSVFVSRRAREFLEQKLKNSRYGTPDALDHITQRFDETTKRLFRDRKDLQFIPFGSPLDKDPSVGIRGGQLKLTGDEVADLFEPSINAAFTAIKAQIDASQGVIRSVFLVGGYAASPWLFSQLQERLAPYNITVSRPDTQTSKAVADGAIGFYCDHHVSARIAKFMYGVEFLRELDLRDPDHVARQGRLCELPSGPKLLPDAFDCILSRGVKVKESTVFTRKYCTELTSLSMLSVFEVEIWCYRGGNVIPKWIIRHAEDFSTLCVVRADLSPLSGSAEPKVGANGKRYWTIVFSIEIHFGLTEFKARIKWVDDGRTKYGPATIVYNERGHRADEDEPDVFPEDDVGLMPPEPRNRLRSEPVSRALTPTDPYLPSGTGERSQRSSMVDPPYTGVPEVARQPTPEPTPPASKASSTSPFTADTAQDLSRSLGIEPENSVKGKGKEKTPKSTPKGTPKIGDTLSSVWGANPATNPPSPIPPSPLSLALDGPKTPQYASTAHTPKGKDRKKSMDTTSTRPSPSLANRSPLGTTAPIVEQPAEQPASIESPPAPVASPPAPAPASPAPAVLSSPTLASAPPAPASPAPASPAPAVLSSPTLASAPPASASLAPASPAPAPASPAPPAPATPAPATPAAPPTESLVEASTSLPAALSGEEPAEQSSAPQVEQPSETVTKTPAAPAEPAELPAQSPAAVPTVSPGGLPPSQVTSPTTAGNKKKKKGASKGASPAVDTKTAPPSKAPSAVATPVVTAAEPQPVEPQLVDTGSAPPTEQPNPDSVPDTIETALSEAPPAPSPAVKPLSAVPSIVNLPETTVNVVTVPLTADANVISDASTGGLGEPPEGSSLFSSDNANAENISSFGWGSGLKTPKTPKTPKAGTTPGTPWGKSPGKAGGSSFGGINSGAGSPRPPSIAAAKSPWGASLGLSPKPPLDKPGSSPGPTWKTLGDDLPKSTLEDHAAATAPVISGPTAAEPDNALAGTSPNNPTEVLSAPETLIPASSSKLNTPKPTESLLDAAEATTATGPESTTEPATAAHPAPSSEQLSPKPEVSATEATVKPEDESNDQTQPDAIADVEPSEEPTVEPKTPATETLSPTAENGDGDGDGGGGDEDGGEGLKGNNNNNTKNSKKKKKGKKGGK